MATGSMQQSRPKQTPALLRLGFLPCLLALCLGSPATTAESGITVVDDRGREIRLPESPQRIVSLAPHITELLFAIGAGEWIVGTVDHADHPPQALSVARIGSAMQFDLERILELSPDLIIAWATGNPRAQMEQLERFGIPVYYSEPADLSGVALDLRRLGRLTGMEDAAEAVASSFEMEIQEIRDTYSSRSPVSVFYQVWDQPLMTVNDSHLIGEAIRLCGGRNIFGALEPLVPRPGLEAVLAADPEAIVTGGPGEDRADWLQPWRSWQGMTAVQRDNLYFVPPSLLQRHTPRIADGTRVLCEALDQARLRRPSSP